MTVYDDMDKKMGEPFVLARQLAKLSGHDPDALVMPGQPPLVHVPNGLYHYVMIAEARPLWTTYIAVARAALGVELK